MTRVEPHPGDHPRLREPRVGAVRLRQRQRRQHHGRAATRTRGRRGRTRGEAAAPAAPAAEAAQASLPPPRRPRRRPRPRPRPSRSSRPSPGPARRPRRRQAGKKSTGAAASTENQKIYDAKNGATDIGVTKDSIKLGSINMHGMALGNVITAPMVRGNLAAASAINDRGGVLGRRLVDRRLRRRPGRGLPRQGLHQEAGRPGQDLLAGHRRSTGRRPRSTTTSSSTSCPTSARGPTARPSGRTRTCSPPTCR